MVRNLRPRGPVLVVACALWALLTPCERAIAQPRGSLGALEYVVDGDGCPTEQRFVDMVSATLGYDPFVHGSDRRTQIEVHQIGSQLSAELRVIDGQRDLGSRRVRMGSGDCRAALEALAIAAGVILDPLGTAATDPSDRGEVIELSERRPAEEEQTSVLTRPLPLEPDAPARSAAQGSTVGERPDDRSPPEEPAWDLGLHGAASAWFGLTPTSAVGAAVAVSARGRWWLFDLSVEGLGTPMVESVDGLRATVLTLGPRACLVRGPFHACLGGRIGPYWAWADAPYGDSVSRLFASVDADSGLTWLIGGPVYVGGGFAVRVPLLVPVIALSGTPVWRAERVAVGAQAFVGSYL